MGKTNIRLTNNNLFTIYSILLFPVVVKGMSRPEQSHGKIKKYLV